MAKKGRVYTTLVAFLNAVCRINNVLQLCKELLPRKHLLLRLISRAKKGPVMLNLAGPRFDLPGVITA